MRQMAILAIIGLTTPTLAVADPGENWQGGYGHMMWGGGYGMFGGLMMILFWGIVIALIVFAVKWFTVCSATTVKYCVEGSDQLS